MAKKRSAIKEDEDDQASIHDESPQKRPRRDNDNPPSPIRKINPPGKPPEAGIITRVSVENFMCHRKLTIKLCKNVNFIHGQNGSGKSAILAAIQICLGAGAKRTHRARNLKDLVRKEGSANNAKVRVTLLNKGPDAYKHDTYGDSITIERSISLGGGYNGYKILDHDDNVKSKLKKDLDTLLDQLNIQVENPVAVLDQEEAKKFLCGKPEDKYTFFSKATELERLDNQYASIYDKILDMRENRSKVENSLLPKKEIVEQLKKEWEQFQILEKMVDKIEQYHIGYAWSWYWELKEAEDETNEHLQVIKKKLEKRREDLAKAESMATSDSNEEAHMNEKLQEYTDEAGEVRQLYNQQEQEYKDAMKPLKQKVRSLHSLTKEINAAKKRHREARLELDRVRNEFMQRAGSAQSEEAKRTKKKKATEEEITALKEGHDERQHKIREAQQKYSDDEIPEQTAKESLDSARRQMSSVQHKLQGLKSSEDNSIAMFGNKCVPMYEKVEQAKRDRRFKGHVLGPIGNFLKVVDGKEHLAALATSAVKVGLDRFIVTNDHDRALFLKLRGEIGCNSRECSVIQTNEGARYNVYQPPEGVETVATVIRVSNDLVFNCLVDSGRIDQLALMTSKEESQQALLVQQNGKSSVRGGNIKEVHFLPDGDFWQVYSGAVSMTSNTRKLRQQIGVDRTTSIRQTEREIEQLSFEINDKTHEFDSLKKKRHQYKVQWNRLKKDDNNAKAKIEALEESIERIQEEAAEAENVTFDTQEYEDDVKETESACEELKCNETQMQREIEEMKVHVSVKQSNLDETRARSEKVNADLNIHSEKISERMRSLQQRVSVIEKKRVKVEQAEHAHTEFERKLEEDVEKAGEAKYKAQKLIYQGQDTLRKRENVDTLKDEEPRLEDDEKDTEIRSIEPVSSDKARNYWEQRIKRGEKKIEAERQRRQMSEVDPEVALEKYQRAEKDLDETMKQVQVIKDNEEVLIQDLKERKDRWKAFRSHISTMSNNSFDEILNTKGSSGFIEFDHKNKQLNLVVQKDNRDEMTQTNDVKALSGGERSFTTLSLLLALGESLETPFRVMDEFDVFLDPVARKIALENLITLAKSMENRQFIFITPQDLSNIKTDPKLLIFQMKPPARSQIVGGATQQTLEFAPSQQ